MRCPECGNNNPEGAKFCIKCGAKFSQVCPQCGAGNPPQAVYCEQCGASLVPTEAGRPRRGWLPYVAAFVGAVLVLAAVVVLVLYVGPAMGWWPSIWATPTAVPPTPEPTLLPQPTEAYTPPIEEPTADLGELTVTLPPPLAGVEFPTQAVDYPSDWPADLRYPESFTLVGTSSGRLEGGAEGWGAKLRYQGEPPSAADELSSFFTSQGWQVAERAEMDSGGVLLLVQRDGDNGSGVIVLDPDLDNPGTTKSLITIFP
jgi:ribosomal protein L40E